MTHNKNIYKPIYLELLYLPLIYKNNNEKILKLNLYPITELSILTILCQEWEAAAKEFFPSTRKLLALTHTCDL